MQAIRIIDIYAKYIKKINTRLFDKIILINMHEIYIINMHAKIINNSYWPFNGKKVCVVQFGPFLNHQRNIVKDPLFQRILENGS